jgi:tetratricopeptide (TPR) repeat protein
MSPAARVFLGASIFLAPVATHAVVRDHLSAVALFTLADQARTVGREDQASAIYDALSHDPDPEIRAEALFRNGMMLAEQRKYKKAAIAFRRLLDEKPDATRVRLELARLLALIGDENAARRELRQARAEGLPSDVAIVVDQFANALRSRQGFGGSFEIALAPDSNINRATNARTLDTVIAPLTLSRDARSTSGIGLRAAGQGYARLPVATGLSLVPRLSGQGDLYRHGDFNDISASALIGLEWQVGRDRLSPSIGVTWRYYGGPLYARTQTAALNWLHPMGQRTQIEVQASANRARYVRNKLQDGGIYALRLGMEHALGRRSGGSLTVDAARQSARDPGYATWSGGGSLLAWRDIGRATVFLSAGIHRLEGDDRLFLFPYRRQEWLIQVGGGASFRRLMVAGFAPVLRVNYERNQSTLGLYDYHRIVSQIGVTRAF